MKSVHDALALVTASDDGISTTSEVLATMSEPERLGITIALAKLVRAAYDANPTGVPYEQWADALRQEADNAY